MNVTTTITTTKRTGVFATAAILAVLILFLIGGMSAHAASGYTWDASTGTLTVTTNEATSLWRSAIHNKSVVRHIVVADGVTMIRNESFKGCGAVDVSIGSTVTQIGSSAFRNCTALTSVTIPQSVQAVGANAFRGDTSLAAVQFCDSAATIGDYAFADCTALQIANLGQAIGYVGASAFHGDNNLVYTVIPASAQITSDKAFQDTRINSFTLPDTYVIPNWLRDAIKTQYRQSGIYAYVLYVPTSMEEYYEVELDGLEHELSIAIDIQPITASPFASMVVISDADTAGHQSFCYGVAQQIYNSNTDAVITITTDTYMSFDRQIYAALMARPDVELVVHYNYHGEAHTFYIAPDTNMVYLYNGNDYVSFRYLESKLSNDKD